MGKEEKEVEVGRRLWGWMQREEWKEEEGEERMQQVGR